MGASPYATAYDVWLRVTGRHEQKESPVMRRGKMFEPVLSVIAQEDLGLKIERNPVGLENRLLWQNDGVPLRASADAFAVGPDGYEVVEYKTASPFTRSKWGPEAPHHYALQVQWYLFAFQRPRGHLVALVGLDDVRHYVLEADAGLQKQMLKAAKAFWEQHVATDVAPSMEGSALASEYLAKTNPSLSDDVLPADEQQQKLIIELLEAQEARKRAEAVEENIKNNLKAIIGTRRGLITPTASVTWGKHSEKKVVDWEAVAQDAQASPILIEKHTTWKAGPRVFRVTQKGAK
jgi:predicted phage-related endonuclease